MGTTCPSSPHGQKNQGVLGYILNRDPQVAFLDLKLGQSLLFLRQSFVQLAIFLVPEILHYFFGSQICVEVIRLNKQIIYEYPDRLREAFLTGALDIDLRYRFHDLWICCDRKIIFSGLFLCQKLSFWVHALHPSLSTPILNIL